MSMAEALSRPARNGPLATQRINEYSRVGPPFSFGGLPQCAQLLIGAGGGVQHLYDVPRLPVHSRHVASMQLH
jgi:hypothetical protein